ncbi:hypothetical protein KCP74_20340 [Salmonella enterica subsp. enterica]|nr:hypothetical protein KCP74_20340 [Salmonella enterica subsp. enterica]
MPRERSPVSINSGDATGACGVSRSVHRFMRPPAFSARGITPRGREPDFLRLLNRSAVRECCVLESASTAASAAKNARSQRGTIASMFTADVADITPKMDV